MKRIVPTLLICCLVVAVATPDALAFVNEVIVESKQVAEGEIGVTVGVYVENDATLAGMTLPLEMRSVTPGSYIASVSTPFSFAVQGRVGSSGLMDFPTLRKGIPIAPSNSCSGPVSSTFSGLPPDPPVDFVSPDAVFFAGLATMSPFMSPGSDTTAGGAPSFLLTFDVTSTAGYFEIDTCCVAPANHVQYVDGLYQPVLPAFTKGVVTIGEPPPPNNPPVAQCVPGGINTPPGLCERASIDPAIIDDGSYDPDAGDAVTLSVYPAGPYAVGVHDIWLVATDTHGAADTCQTTLTVVDDEDPVVTCPGSVIVGNDPDECGAIVTWDPATATDNCDVESVSCDSASGAFFAIGETLVECIAVDVNGNADTCTFTVTVNDTQPLVADCPGDITVGNDPSQCGALVDFSVGASDNCPGATATAAPASGSWFDIGATLVEVIATNPAGDADTCTFTVTVQDTTMPLVVCSDVNMPNTPGQCGRVTTFSVGTDDNCGVDVTYSPLGSGDYFPVGTTEVIATGTDPSGNVDICTLYVTIYDDDDPVLTCGGDITVSNDADECGAVVNYESNLSVVDNCPGLFVVGTPTSGSLFPVGTTEVEVVATDASDNADTCYFNVIVEDDQAPVIAGCPAGDYEVSNDPDECGATLSFDGIITATDNCDVDVALTGVPIDQFFPLGSTPVSITATDDDGNSALCEFNVVVTDDELPTAMCPNDTAVIVGPLDTEEIVTWTSTVDDNCPGATITCVPPSGSTFPLGPTLVTCTAVDDAGNEDQCTFTVTVSSELVPPVAQCTDVTVVAEPAPPKDGDVPLCANWDANIDNGSFDPDGGPVTMVQEPAPPYYLGSQLVKLIVTDDEGDKDTCEATVTVVDETPPNIQCNIDRLELAVGDDCILILPDLRGDGLFTADDACDLTLDSLQGPPPGTPLGVGEREIWMYVVDDGDNWDSCSFTLAVVDSTPPTLSCPGTMALFADENCEAEVPDMSAIIGADDNCTPFELLAITQDPAAGTPLSVGSHPVGVTVTDEAGQFGFCEVMLDIQDTIPPTLTCPGDTTIPNDPGECSAMWDGMATADDNCQLDYVNCNPIMPPAEKIGGAVLLPIGPTLFECVAVDMAGNQTTCTYTVTVEDTEPPYLQCPTEIVESTCDPAGLPVFWAEPFYGDNCGVLDSGCDPAPGSMFPPGVTTVFCWMEDESGNRDSCYFDVTVNFEPPRFVVIPDTLWFTADCAENPDPQCVVVDYDPGNCPIDKDLFLFWMASANQPWIMVAPPSGEVGQTFCVNLEAASLAPGDYEGLVLVEEDFTKPINGTWPDSVVIMLTVNDIGFDQIAVSPDTLFFEMDFDNPGDGLCQWVSLWNEGCGETCWQLFDDPADWITVTPTGGMTPDDVEVCVDPCNLPEGEYTDTLIFCVCPDPDPDKEPKVPGCAAVLVKMTVLNPPILMVDPTHLIFNEAIPADHAPKQVDVTNIGGGSLTWAETHKEPWLQVNPSSGPAPGSMDVSIDFGSLMGPDTLRDTIMVTADCALFSPLWVIVDVYLPCDDLCGLVMLADDGPAAGAVVQAWTNWPEGIMIDDAVVDVDGMFCLSGLGAYDGPFDIRIVKMGYCTKIIEDIACGAADFDAELEPIPFTANPAWPFFADYWSVDARVFGVPLMPGDVILAMDPDGVLCGVTTVVNAGEYLIHVLGDDPNTPGDEGAAPGDMITLLLNCNCPAIAPDPWMDQGDFQYDVDFQCNRKTIECALCYPWNLLSLNVVPADPGLEAVLGSIDGKYDRAYSATCDDGSLSWERDRPINDLTALTHMYGFGLRVTEPDLTLIVSGFEFPVQTPINLCEGWNLIPYWPDEADTLTHALASIAGLYEQIIGFECDGAHTWVAGRPINDLFCLEPCNGYWIKMTQAATLTYPIADYSCGVVDAGPLPKVANRIDRLSVTPYQADFWSTADPTITGVVDGDVITAYTIDGTLCGEAVVGAAGAFLMHVYGDDPSSAQVEGAVDGERLTFRVNGEPARVVDGSAVWSDRGSNHVTLLVESAGALRPTEYALFQNYPNPFNAGTAIRFQLKGDADVSLVIYNVLGQAVRDLYNGHLTAGDHTLTWDGRTDNDRSAQSGVYFYRIATSDWTDVKKMTLLK